MSPSDADPAHRRGFLWVLCGDRLTTNCVWPCGLWDPSAPGSAAEVWQGIWDIAQITHAVAVSDLGVHSAAELGWVARETNDGSPHTTMSAQADPADR
jgi:hypothetical protein